MENWSYGNPIDILGDADPERYAIAIAISLNNPQSDALLVTVTTSLAKNAAEAIAIADEIGFPVVLKLHSETLIRVNCP